MSHTDPIGDLLTRIRNASTARHKNVAIPASMMKTKILEILVAEGYVKSLRAMKNKGKSFIDVELRYRAGGEPMITGIKRLSKPGLRIYCGYREIPRVRSGYGVSLLSTPKGIITDKTARQDKVGGELIFSIY